MSPTSGRGTRVWTARKWQRISWSRERGYEEVHAPVPLTVRKARWPYRCASCRIPIDAGTLHGSDAGEHHCLGCCTGVEPAEERYPIADITRYHEERRRAVRRALEELQRHAS